MSKLPETTGTAIDNEPRPTWLHPLSGGAILALDWLLFSGNALSGGLATPVVVIGGFALGAFAVAGIQRRTARDAWNRALLKGIVSGIVVGFPMPIAGTALGGAVLGLSGLSALRTRLLKGRDPSS